MITVEFNNVNKMLEIHFDIEGANQLIEKVQILLNQNGNEHTHLMSDAWGGDDLSSEKLNISDDTIIVNHLKLSCWK